MRRTSRLLRLADGTALLIAAATCLFLMTTTTDGAPHWMMAALFMSWFAVLDLSRGRATTVRRTIRAEQASVLRSTFIVAGIMALVAVGTANPGHRTLLLVALPIGTSFILAIHWLLHLYVARRAPEGLRPPRTIVIGRTEDLGTESALQRPGFTRLYDVVGSLAPEPEPAGERSPEATGAREIDRVLAFREESDAEIVIVAGSISTDRNFIRNLGWSLEDSGCSLVVAPLPANISRRRLNMVRVEGLPLLSIDPPTFRGGKYYAKRGFDVAVAALALVLLAPLSLMVALVIRAEDGKPALFRQTRAGANGRPFTMYKFRTMCVDAEAKLEGLRTRNEGNAMLFKLREDPRVTRVGRWLRKFSIDELPQLLNVLGGSMSLVGPRPPLPSEVANYSGHTPRRLLVKPGLTGLWQVSGRSDLDWEESVGLDLYYVENWTLGFDLEIIRRTIGVVLKPVGAY